MIYQHEFTSYTNKEKKMVIQEIGSNNRRVHGVSICHVEGLFGWRRDDGNRVIFYPSTHWEPVEEWVKIEVSKRDVGRLPFMTSYVDGDTLKWRYPQ